MKNLLNHSEHFTLPESVSPIDDTEAERLLNKTEAESTQTKDDAHEYFNERLTVAMYRAYRMFKAAERYSKRNLAGDLDTMLNPQEIAVIRTLPYLMHFVMQFIEEVLYRVASDEEYDVMMPGHRLDNVDIMFMIPAMIGMSDGGSEMLEAMNVMQWHPGFNENHTEGGKEEHPFYGRQAADVGELVVNKGMSGAMMFSSLIHDRAKEYGMDTKYSLFFAGLAAFLVEVEGHFAKGNATERERIDIKRAVATHLDILSQIKKESDDPTPNIVMSLVRWQLEDLLGEDIDELIGNTNNQD